MRNPRTPASPKILLGERMSTAEFIAAETIGFAAQVMVFFLVAAFVSRMFQEEQSLANYLNSKVHEHTIVEFCATVVALVAVVGILFVFVRGGDRRPSSFVQRVGDEVILDLPRVLYALGSSITGPVLAVGCFLIRNPQNQVPGPGWWFAMAAFFALFFLVSGVSLSYYLKRSTHIRIASETRGTK